MAGDVILGRYTISGFMQDEDVTKLFLERMVGEQTYRQEIGVHASAVSELIAIYGNPIGRVLTLALSD